MPLYIMLHMHGHMHGALVASPSTVCCMMMFEFVCCEPHEPLVIEIRLASGGIVVRQSAPQRDSVVPRSSWISGKKVPDYASASREHQETSADSTDIQSRSAEHRTADVICCRCRAAQ
jgi:hypothetical protein